MWPSVIFGSLLVLASAGLVAGHVLARRRRANDHLDDLERVYRVRQFRHRMQASALLGVVGLAVIGGNWVDGPPGEALYWSGVLMVVLWVLFLAGADAASTQSFFREEQKRQAAEHLALQKEIERFRKHEDNGHD
jgi:hypothetical protein